MPARLITPRLLLRSWTREDAAGLKDAIDSSLAELVVWLPWARREPTPIEELTARCGRFADDFRAGRDHFYGIFERAGRVVGGAGLHPRRKNGGLEIGYWLRTDRTGRGYVTEAAAALTRAALELCGVRRVEIRVDPHNDKSAAIPRRLGYRHRTTIKPRVEPGDLATQSTLWTIVPSEWSRGHPAWRPLRAEDADGRALIDDL